MGAPIGIVAALGVRDRDGAVEEPAITAMMRM
jgi:hypothetical protein